MVMNASPVSMPSGSSHPNQTRISDDRYIPGFKKLVDVVHGYEVPCALQLYHAGRQRYGLIAGPPPSARPASPTPCARTPHGL